MADAAWEIHTNECRCPVCEPRATRRSWNWRAVMTPGEAQEVKRYDDAMKRVAAAQAEADRYRLTFSRIQNRCLQRAKYRDRRTNLA